MGGFDAAFAARLGARTRAAGATVAERGWDDVRLQLAVLGLLGARLRAQAQGQTRFDRERALLLLQEPGERLDAAARAAFDEPRLCDHVSGIVDELAHTDLGGQRVQDVLHGFYGPFLAAFDPQGRKRRGVYYTRPALASYVVREVDRRLSEVCGVELGLADASQQIVDPAVGSGVFLSAVVACVHRRMQAVWRARGLDELARRAAWQAYVRSDLLPRVSGFDVLPVACELARLQLRLTLAATGYVQDGSERLGIHEADVLALLEPCLRDESEHESLAALRRVSVIIANPPYARAGRGDAFWQRALAPYKAGLEREKNLQPLADEYVRFVRFTELLLSRRPDAVAGLVTSSTFLDGHLHRAMRASLRRTFAQIEVLDLGGSAKRSARDATSARDDNLFEVGQGIAVTFLLRKAAAVSCPVRHAALRGGRDDKLARLEASADPPIEYQSLRERSADAPFVPTCEVPAEYASFPALDELFTFWSIGAKPGDDRHLVAFSADELIEQLERFRGELRAHPEHAHTEAARRMLAFDAAFDPARIVPYAYRPFDTRFVYDDARLWTRPVRRLRERIDGEPWLLSTRLAKDGAFAHVLATRLLSDVICLSNKSSVNSFAFARTSLAHAHHDRDALFAYLYAVLSSQSYRARYAAALSLGFPRVPLARSRVLFDALAEAGASLLALHLGERAAQSPRPVFEGTPSVVPKGVAALTTLASDGGAALRLPLTRAAAFRGVSPAAWQQRVGGYQVAHKWLLDRERAQRPLHAAELARYAELLALLDETHARGSAIDATIAAHGGVPDAFEGA